jgi:hypothetical protein
MPQLFEYLLQQGADPDAGPCSAIDVVVQKGYGWEVGEVRARLAALIEKYRAVPKQPAAPYRGPPMGETAARRVREWQAAGMAE